MSISPPLRYTPAVEQITTDESETISKINDVFDEILNTTSKDYGHAVRAVHAKSHGIIEGVLTIEPRLAPELAQGLFAKPGEHKVYMRFSTNAGDILPDAVSLPRGLAIKVLDVEGDRLPDADGHTQDFVMVNGPVFQAKTADQFLSSLELVAKTTDVAESGKVALSAVLRTLNKFLTAIGIKSTKIQSMGGAPNVDPLGETYFSVTPFRYGDFIAKFSLKPVSQSLRNLTGIEISASQNPNAVRDTVRSEMRYIDGEWELRVQLCRDLKLQPIEDSTVEWKEVDSPFQKVATIKANRQDSWDEDKVEAVDEAMRFSVWTGLAAHQPLGNINRARKATYKHSAQFRASFNRCPLHEPTSDTAAIARSESTQH